MIVVTITINEARHAIDIKTQSHITSTTFERKLARNFEETCKGIMAKIIETTPPLAAKGRR
jgi:hypothetical protein